MRINVKNNFKIRLAILMILWLGCVVCGSGCTIGYRYHHVDSAVTSAAGTSGRVEGGGHMVELGVVLDFRYLRLILPYLGANYELELSAGEGSGGRQSSMMEKRGIRLDVPVLSLWNGENGWEAGYPGVMEHRESVELWLSGTGRFSRPGLGFADLGLVYYHHDLVAVRAFGGWGAAPFERNSTSFGPGGLRYEYWEESVGGPTAGVELTVGAGEQALDFIKFFVGNQKAIEEQMR
jgi:hypothetical protein